MSPCAPAQDKTTNLDTKVTFCYCSNITIEQRPPRLCRLWPGMRTRWVTLLGALS